MQPVAGPTVRQPVGAEAGLSLSKEEWTVETARVGKQAPDFEAPAYVVGQGFKNIRLSDYQGKWVVLCFYPGDFTFV